MYFDLLKNPTLLGQVELILEEMRANMIQSAKSKNLDWVKSEKSINGVVMANFSVYGSQIINEVMNRLGLGKEQASALVGQAMGNLYDKYNK
ncbi:MAG: hypothetical protein ACM3MI_08525 [Clostridiales bacterium]